MLYTIKCVFCSWMVSLFLFPNRFSRVQLFLLLGLSWIIVGWRFPSTVENGCSVRFHQPLKYVICSSEWEFAGGLEEVTHENKMFWLFSFRRKLLCFFTSKKKKNTIKKQGDFLTQELDKVSSQFCVNNSLIPLESFPVSHKLLQWRWQLMAKPPKTADYTHSFCTTYC